MAPFTRDDGGATIDPREERLFRALDDDNDDVMPARDFERVLAQIGLMPDDARLAESLDALRAKEERDSRMERQRRQIGRGEFFEAVRHNILLIERALQGRMVIPDFTGFCDDVTEIFDTARAKDGGAPADYIPQLDLKGADADRFGLALCSVDGQRFSLGDAQDFFSVQSTSKTVNYCLALEEHGADTVHHFVGHEPSGCSFNELTLNKNDRPHNPMINAGAIMSASLIGLTAKRDAAAMGAGANLAARGVSGERIEYVMDRWKAASGGAMPRFNTPVYLSERATADRNYAISYFMREKGAFPDDVELEDVLDFYFQCCSIEMNTEMMSVVAATLANGGICPLTNERVFQTETVQKCLSLMSSCGMYDYSGEFAFKIGLPAKSGVSGAIMVVVPNVMGFCTWSPRLDEIGNSVRGLDFCHRLTEEFNLHKYDNLTGGSRKKDPRKDPVQVRARQVNEMIWAASKGDLGAIQDQLMLGTDVECKDYDLRTPLHLAAADNQLHIVRFFIEQAASDDGSPDINSRDRWGGTPLDDAYQQGHREIIALLETAHGERGTTSTRDTIVEEPRSSAPLYESAKTDELIWAASLGDMGCLRRLVAQGVPLDLADYDHRTALHLAAAEGHLDAVRYLVSHGVSINPLDRWHNTPLDDARRHGQHAVAEFLMLKGGRADGHTADADLRNAA
jgi:glutaminase